MSHVPADASRIVAAVQASNIPAGASVQASWVYNDTPLEDFTTTLPIDRQIDETWINFHIERSAEVLWPAGLYEVAIQLDGEVVQEASIEVWDTG